MQKQSVQKLQPPTIVHLQNTQVICPLVSIHGRCSKETISMVKTAVKTFSKISHTLSWMKELLYRGNDGNKQRNTLKCPSNALPSSIYS